MPDLPDPIAKFFGINPVPTHTPVPKPRKFLNELIILPGHPFAKKNNAQTVTFTRKDGSSGSTVIPTKKYQEWEHRASAALGRIGRPIPIDERVNVQMRFYLGRDYKVDLSALYEGPQDLLVKAGFLIDDNYRIVASHNGSGVELDRSNPRTEILICPKG